MPSAEAGGDMSEQEDPGATEEWKAKWEIIPPDSRDLVVTFLSVQDKACCLVCARQSRLPLNIGLP